MVIRSLVTSVAALFLLVGPDAGGAARAADTATPVGPAGFERQASEELAPGLLHETWVRTEPEQVLHVARIAAGAPLELDVVLSNEAVSEAPPFERTTSACARTSCLAAVNGDFAFVETGEPVGAVVTNGELARSPSPQHQQLSIGADGVLSAGALTWTGQLMPTDLKPVTIQGVNVGRGDGQLILYTPRFAPTTETNPHGVELVLQVVEPAPPLQLGTTSRVLVRDLVASGSTPIAADTVVLSGHGAGADTLRALWQRVQDGAAGRHALLRLETPSPIDDSVGGAPVLVKEGKRWVGDDGSNFVAGRHPRTLVGWTPGGDTLLVTADGRQPGHSLGVSLPEAAELMMGLGATEAINLDGGGSTTFVAGGAVRNSPSDRLVERRGRQMVVHAAAPGDQVIGSVERAVVSAVVVRARDGAPSRAPAARADALAVPLGHAGADVTARRTDPASDHSGRQPALIAVVSPGSVRVAPAVFALVAFLAVLAALIRFALAMPER